MIHRKGFQSLNMLIVSAYKLVGFGVLSAILVGLVSYLGMNLFYMVDRGWLAPTVVSRTDARVLQLSAQLAQESSLRDKLQADRRDLLAKKEDLMRVISAEREFQGRFRVAVQADLAARAAELSRLSKLVSAADGVRGEVMRSSAAAYAEMSREQLQQHFEARLINREDYITGNYQISQIARSNLSLAQDEATLLTRVDALRREVRSLGALAQHGPALGSAGPFSHEVLRMQQELSRSGLELERAKLGLGTIESNIAALDRAIASHERIIKVISESPYLRAIEGGMTIAFVPYDNQEQVHGGVVLYGCRLGPLLCSRVGHVEEILPGEVSVNHPIYNHVIRGLMVRMRLFDEKWAQQKVLFAGRAPLLL